MSADPAEGDQSLSPDEAFGVLGNETRMAILQTLADATQPLSFSELRDEVGIRQGAQFNYHLDKLVGHFVRKDQSGYQLRQAATRVVEAVVSGSVTETATLEPAEVAAPCPFCGANIEISFREERMLLRCPSCPGAFSGLESTSPAFPRLPRGSLALFYLPSAGLTNRTRKEMLDAVLTWTYSEHLAIDHGVCPRCSSNFEFSIEWCDSHADADPICSTCDRRYSILVASDCVNCPHFRVHQLTNYVFYRSEVRPFFETRDINPILPRWEDMHAVYDYEEELLSRDPFATQIRYTVDEDSLVATVDGDLSITDVSEEPSQSS